MMSKKLKRISSLIDNKFGSRSVFADAIKFNKPHLYNFLNGKVNIGFDILEKIIDKVNMDVLENLPEKFIEVNCVYVDGVTYKVGNDFEDKEVFVCFGTGETSHQGLLLRDKKGMFTLKIF